MLVFRHVELDRDAGVQDQLAGTFSLAQVLESRSARMISVESEKVRPEAASLSENSRARFAHFLGSPLGRDLHAREEFVGELERGVDRLLRAPVAKALVRVEGVGYLRGYPPGVDAYTVWCCLPGARHRASNHFSSLRLLCTVFSMK